MRKNLSRFLRLQKELLGQRLSNSAKFNGTIIPKKKQHGKEKMTFGKTTLTYLLANPNLEGEIHLKGVRFVTPIEDVTWAIFEDGFRTAHISSGVMNFKKKEFHNLKQRHRSVAEYIVEFNNQARYAPYEVDTDAKRKVKLLEGLNDEMNLQLSVAYVPTYQ